MFSRQYRFFGRPSGRLLCIWRHQPTQPRVLGLGLRQLLLSSACACLGLVASHAASASGNSAANAKPAQHAAVATRAVAVAEPLADAASLPVLRRLAAAGASADVQQLVDWVLVASDHQQLPFVIIDKPNARAFAFAPDGRLLGNAPVLLGAAKGDQSVPGIGDRPLAQVLPQERTTPAGRFVADLGHNAQGEDIVWVDYDAAVSMHRVRTSNRSERRLQRLASATVADNRISYGCINLPRSFYEHVVSPAFQRAAQAGGTRAGVVYVLPDSQPMRAVFGYLKAAALLQVAALPS